MFRNIWNRIKNRTQIKAMKEKISKAEKIAKERAKRAKEAEKALAFLHKPVKIAIMGCVVNGPGEARDADFGIAGGKGEGLVFRKGEIIRKVPEAERLAALVEEAKRYEG